MKFTGISDGAFQNEQHPEGPFELLLGCHARIRHFMQLSRTLADAESAPHKEISEAANSVFRYFSLALPLHEADENKSLFPHLCDSLPERGLLHEAAVTMVEQHKAIDELAAELLSLSSSLGRHPERLASLSRRLSHVTEALSQIFAVHLQLEETVIFPSAREILTPKQIEEISHEMHQRRQPPSGTIHLVQ